MDQELWTKKDVARFLRRSVSSIDHAVSSRKIPYLKVSRHVRFDPQEVRAWLAQMSVKPIGNER
jgi:excisionase family DNA binding protein